MDEFEEQFMADAAAVEQEWQDLLTGDGIGSIILRAALAADLTLETE